MLCPDGYKDTADRMCTPCQSTCARCRMTSISCGLVLLVLAADAGVLSYMVPALLVLLGSLLVFYGVQRADSILLTKPEVDENLLPRLLRRPRRSTALALPAVGSGSASRQLEEQQRAAAEEAAVVELAREARQARDRLARLAKAGGEGSDDEGASSSTSGDPEQRRANMMLASHTRLSARGLQLLGPELGAAAEATAAADRKSIGGKRSSTNAGAGAEATSSDEPVRMSQAQQQQKRDSAMRQASARSLLASGDSSASAADSLATAAGSPLVVAHNADPTQEMALVAQARADTEDRRRRNIIQQQLKILMGFFQISTTLAFGLDIPWSRTFREFLAIFDFVNLDVVQFSTATCITNVNYYQQFAIVMMLPAFGEPALSLAWPICSMLTLVSCVVRVCSDPLPGAVLPGAPALPAARPRRRCRPATAAAAAVLIGRRRRQQLVRERHCRGGAAGAGVGQVRQDGGLCAAGAVPALLVGRAAPLRLHRGRRNQLYVPRQPGAAVGPLPHSLLCCLYCADLVADFTIVCYSAMWYKVMIINIFMILLYPIGIPLLFFFVLYR